MSSENDTVTRQSKSVFDVEIFLKTLTLDPRCSFSQNLHYTLYYGSVLYMEIILRSFLSFDITTAGLL